MNCCYYKSKLLDSFKSSDSIQLVLLAERVVICMLPNCRTMSSLAVLLRQKGQHLFKTATINVQHKYLDEQCIIVDENDKPLRSATKRFCHSIETLSLHRAFSVFLFTKNQELVLQKRSAQKITFPSVWTNTCCSHPLWNDHEVSTEENDVGVRRAARRKLEHELGIKSADTEQMEVMGRFLYKAMHDDKWGEHEVDHAIIIRDFDIKQIRPNPEEVEDIAAVSFKKLEEMLKSSETLFSPWFQLFVRQNFLQKWWQNLDHLDSLKDFSTIHRLN